MTGRPPRRRLLAASVTGVALMPAASSAIVVPVAGAMIRASASFCGPSGSTPCSVVSGSWPVSSNRVCRRAAAVPKRVSSPVALALRMGRISHPRAVSTCIWGSTAEKLQKLPHSAKAAVRFGRVVMARSFLSALRVLPEWPARSGQSALRRSAGRSAPAGPVHARRAGPAPRRRQNRCRRAGWQGR